MNLNCGCNLPKGHYELCGWHMRPATIAKDHPFADREGGYHPRDVAYEECVFAQAARARARMGSIQTS